MSEKTVVVRTAQQANLSHSINPKTILAVFWQYRELIQQFSRRFLTENYRGSALGLFWILIEPLVTLLVYTFVFGVIFDARWTTETDLNFAVILFAGLIAHNLFAQIVLSSAAILTRNVSYIKKVLFPPEILIFSSVAASVIQSLISTGMLLVILFISAQALPLTLFLLPIVMIPLILMATGFGFFFAAISVIVEDTRHFLLVAMQMLFFLTPIVYDIQIVPEQLRWVLRLNPMTWVVEAYRNVLLFNRGGDPISYLVLLFFSIVVCLLGYAWFSRLRPVFADYI